MTNAANLASAAGTGFFRNRIINGGMDIWQRGTSISISAAQFVYVADRFLSRNASNVTISRSTDVPSSAGTSFQYSLKFQRDAGQTSTSGNYLVQIIESVNCYDLSGQTVTVSFWAKKGANFSSSGNVLNLQVATGTAADQGQSSWWSGFSGGAVPINSNSTLTTSWQRFSYTGTIGAGVLEMAVQFYYGGTGTAGADDSFFITGVQLEVGSVATPFERRQYGTELALCQRYYYRINYAASEYVATLQCWSSSSAYGIVAYPPVPMRATPTSVSSSAISTFALSNSTSNTAVIATAFSLGVAGNGIITCGGADRTGGGLTAGNAAILLAAGTAYLAASAEL